MSKRTRDGTPKEKKPKQSKKKLDPKAEQRSVDNLSILFISATAGKLSEPGKFEKKAFQEYLHSYRDEKGDLVTDSFPILEDMASRKINWRKLLSPDSNNVVSVPHKHVHKGCSKTKCQKLLEDSSVRFWSLTHAELVRYYYQDEWRTFFELDNKNSAFNKNVASARSAAESGTIRRKSREDEEDDDKKKVTEKVRPANVNPATFTAESMHAYRVWLVQRLCETNNPFKEALLATKNAILHNGKTQLVALMDARDAIANSSGPSPSILSTGPVVISKQALTSTREPCITIVWGAVAQFPRSYLNVKQLLVLNQNSEESKKLILDLYRQYPSCFYNPMVASQLAIERIAPGQTAVSAGWSLLPLPEP